MSSIISDIRRTLFTEQKHVSVTHSVTYSLPLDKALPIALALLAVLITIFVLPLFVKNWKESPPSLDNIGLPTCPEAAKSGWKPNKILEKPSIVSSSSTKGVDTIVAYCPATGAFLDEIEADSAKTIDEKVRKANDAQIKTLRLHGSDWTLRRRLLKTIKAWIVRDMDDLVRVACRDTGKTAIDAVLGEILVTLSKLDWLIKNGEKLLRPQTRPNNLLLAHKRCKVYFEPAGVITALVSWNYPCHNALSPILAALTSGNSIVVKCSEMVVWSTQYYIEGIHACLRANGLSTDLVQLVCCLPPVAPVLSSHPIIRHLTFIGSEPVAKFVANDAAKSMIPCCLELGGKDPMIILEDASLSFFVQTWLRAAFGSGGQNCIGAERFIVSRKIMPKFIELVTPKVKTLRQGSFLDDVTPGSKQGIDIGAMISDNRFDRLEFLIKDAESKGARILAGGKRFKHPNHPSGHYFSPTLIVDVTSEMQIAQEELFAPVFLVMPFDDVEQAISIANGTSFALGSSVFGGNRNQCRKIAARLHAGMVNINDFAVSYLNQGLPFGGNKLSGNGQRFGGPEGLLSLCVTKAVTEDRFFSLIKTAIPGPVHYPHANPLKAYAFVVGLATFFGAVTWSESLTGLWNLIRASL